MDPSLVVYLGQVFGLDTPEFEALDAAYNALDPLSFLRARLLYAYNISFDAFSESEGAWDQLEPPASIVFPLGLTRRSSLQVIKTFQGATLNLRTPLGTVTYNISFDTPHVEILGFLANMRDLTMS